MRRATKFVLIRLISRTHKETGALVNFGESYCCRSRRQNLITFQQLRRNDVSHVVKFLLYRKHCMQSTQRCTSRRS